MVELNKEEIHQYLLDCMQYLHEICEKYNLYYILCSGSCLGAVRHQGFIPWDDDIDIFVPRNQYDKLINVLANESNIYLPMTYKNKFDYYLPYCKLVDTRTVLFHGVERQISQMGLFIDIFPIDGLPNNIDSREKHIKQIMKIYKLIRVTNGIHTNNLLKNTIKKMLGHLFNSKKLCQKIDLLATKYPLQDSKYAMDIVWGTKPFLYEDVKDRILVPFEDHYFYIPKNYDHYLKTIYGDYMKLPAEDQRVSHELKVFMK